jgi:type III secretion protein U
VTGTLKPTAARQREFRERGDIARSRDAVAALTFTGAVSALLATSEASWRSLTALMDHACRAAEPANDAAQLTRLARLAGVGSQSLGVALQMVGPVLFGAVAGALLGIGLQLGWPPALHRPSRARAQRSAAGQLRQAFGLTVMARRTVVCVLKIAAVGLVVVLALQPHRTAQTSSVPQLLSAMMACCTSALVASALAFLGLGLADYLFARWRLAVRMKMTPEELRREHRQQEPDPAIAARRQRGHHRFGKMGLIEADVVVLAAGEAAVALRYRGAIDVAPTVVARGRGAHADKLAARARARLLPVLSRPPLAQALCDLPEGAGIPDHLFRAVADVLAHATAMTRREAT